MAENLIDYMWNKESVLHQVISVYCSSFTFVFQFSTFKDRKILSAGQDRGFTVCLFSPAFHFIPLFHPKHLGNKCTGDRAIQIQISLRQTHLMQLHKNFGPLFFLESDIRGQQHRRQPACSASPHPNLSVRILYHKKGKNGEP